MQVGSNVNFDTNGPLTSGFTHTAGGAGITIVNAGTYKVTWSVSGTESNQFALFLGPSVVPGSIYGSGAGTQGNTGLAIFAANAGQVLTLRNHTSAAAVGLQPAAGGAAPSTNGSALIEELG